MALSVQIVPSSADHGANPYKDLYIYYIDGHIKESATDFGQDFIGNWVEEGSCFLFFSRPAQNIVAHLLDRQSHLRLLDKYYMTYDQWQGSTQTSFKVGRFLIAPPWAQQEPSPDDIAIILDPGVVFGTGAHTTTQDCLKAVESAFATETIFSVLDLGTGTGLLSIASIYMGAKRALAVDINPLAIETAVKNVGFNDMAGSIAAAQGSAEDFMKEPYNLLIANIPHSVIKKIIASERFLKYKLFILSGLMRSQARDIVDRLSELPVTILKEWHQDDIWYTFLGKIC